MKVESLKHSHAFNRLWLPIVLAVVRPLSRAFLGRTTLFIFLCGLGCFSVEVAAQAQRKIIVHIAVTDSHTFTEAHFRKMRKQTLEMFPRHLLLEIKTNAWTSLFDEALIRKTLISKITGFNFEPGDQITHLVLSDHSSKRKSDTHYKYFGEYGEFGPSERLDKLISPLRTHATRDLTIIQNGCSTLCGGQEAAVRRSAALLKYFSAPDGQIYGSVVPETAPPVFPIYGTLLTTAVALGLNMSADFQITPTVFNGTLVAAIAGLTPAYSKFLSRLLGIFDIGRILRFRNHEIEEAVIVSKFENLAAIYSRSSCVKVLNSSTEVFRAY